MHTWAIKDNNGRILSDWRGASRIEVGCRVLPVRYDPFRVHVAASYREHFERDLNQLLKSKGWRIVRIGRRCANAPATHRGAGATGSSRPEYRAA